MLTYKIVIVFVLYKSAKKIVLESLEGKKHLPKKTFLKKKEQKRKRGTLRPRLTL